MDIVDAQVHLNHLGIDACVAAMDAVGIDAAIIDQYPTDGTKLPNGAVRYRYDVAAEAATRFPGRFGYVARIDPADPDMDRLMAEVRTHPGRLGIRVDQPPAALFADQGYRAFFASAARHRNPVWIVIPGRLDQLIAYARMFPELQFIVDHAGMPETWNRIEAGRFAPLQSLLDLAACDNVAVKWGHMTKMSSRPFPYDDVLSHLRRVVDAFGAERVMWESDWTMCRGHETLAEMLFSVRFADCLSAREKEWVLGRSAETAMRWERMDDKVDVVAVGPDDWERFAANLARQGRLLSGRVTVVRLGPEEMPATGRRVSTAAAPGAARVTIAQAVEGAIYGRIARLRPV